MILAGLAYRDVGQPRFFLFPGNAGTAVSGSIRGASPACPWVAGTTAFGNRTRSQPRQRGCSRGLGCYPNKQKQRFPASPGTAVSSLCGNKDIACQVAHPHKIPYCYIFAPSLVSGGMLSETRNLFTASILQEYISHRIMRYVLWSVVFFIATCSAGTARGP